MLAKTTESPGRVLKPDEAAELLGVTKDWLIREGIGKHKIPHLRPPGSNQIRFFERDMWRVREAWRVDFGIGTPPVKLREEVVSRSRTKRGSRKKKKR